MAYIIYNNDGTVLTTLAEGDVDNESTSLSLVGKNLNNYGEYINQNFVKLLNNFAASTSNEPAQPQTGQLWFNTDTKKLNVYDGSSFKPTYGATVSGTAPVTTSTGDLWFDSINGQLSIWNGSRYKLVGPAVSETKGKFGVEPPVPVINDDVSGLPATVSVLYSHGLAVGLVVPTSTTTSNAFNLSNADTQSYFNFPGPLFINQGITLINNFDLYGDFYIRGERQVPPVKTLSAYADITPYGDPDGADLSPYNTATVKSRIGTANVHIYEQLLPKLFTTSTDYGSSAFPGNSEARVVCYYNTTTSVRRFRITDGVWTVYDTYPTTLGTESTTTNIVI